MSIKVAAFSGSLRKESYTTKLVKAFAAQTPAGAELELVEIGGLPLINQDLEQNLPASVQALKAKVAAADAILLATPEYNRSYSPVLKNALDWGSRPGGQNSWNDKPVAIVSCTPYTLGAFGAAHHLRQVMVFLNMHPLQQPEFYLGGAADKFDADGKLTDEMTHKKIDETWAALIAWTERLRQK
ncbi:MAG TPA: NAD(P)H-dependent oxidoreductase [Candidatus Saccharimonadia bacterium]|nr:NAD(P)H-dependent oxidoreductase [Candidatus Saccharimonadia bacterium]